ncbi:TrmB family transcriptional regulator [Streptomyces sp. NPDC093600]|uniref:TrmB family transcriptional regulator n=1 Tax=Streptomyces sp. NPDC093600 TaxID=3366047 RepID=UPI0037F7722D
MLDVLGLEPDDERVYRALLGQPNSTAVRLADLLTLSRADVGTALSHLTEWGLATGAADERFTAAPPAMALGALITQRRDGLRMAEQALVPFAEEHRAAMTGDSISDLIEVVTGVDAIRHRFLQVQQAARAQVRSFITAPFVALPPDENTAEPMALDRGVLFRAVLDRAVMAEPGIVRDAIDSLRNGVQLRVTDHLPMKLVLADADLGLSPRTLHRRLRRLMDLAGVQTRMQLGAYAVRSGWAEHL